MCVCACTSTSIGFICTHIAQPPLNVQFQWISFHLSSAHRKCNNILFINIGIRCPSQFWIRFKLHRHLQWIFPIYLSPSYTRWSDSYIESYVLFLSVNVDAMFMQAVISRTIWCNISSGPHRLHENKRLFRLTVSRSWSYTIFTFMQFISQEASDNQDLRHYWCFDSIHLFKYESNSTSLENFEQQFW